MSKFTREKADAILDDMRRGSGLGEAAQMQMVTRQTVWNWRKAGRASGRGAKHEFDLQIQALEAQDTAAAAATVKRTMRQRDDVKSALNAATWWLERKLPDEFGRHDRLTVDHADIAKQFLDYLRDRLDGDTYNRVLAALAPDTGDGPAPLSLVK